MIIFEKSNLTIASTKMVIFWLIFVFIFICKFELRNLYTYHVVATSTTTVDTALPPSVSHCLTPTLSPQLPAVTCHSSTTSTPARAVSGHK